jgi:hypothetical protein
MSSSTRLAAAFVLVSAITLGASSPADACGGAIFEASVNDVATSVANAERDLGKGKHVKAVSQVSDAFPGLKLYKVGTGRLADRSLRIMAIAIARNEGGITAAAFRGKTAEQRAENLAWAAQTLQELSNKRPNNPALETDLGEALSKIPEKRAEAMKLLSRLADKDLLATPEGYAALAELRGKAGDKAGREAALKRCASMSTTGAAVCGAPAPSAGPQS